MFNRSAMLALNNKNGRNNIILQEPQAVNSKITIRCVPLDAVVIDLDGVFNNEKLFNGSQGECKRADYLIISEEKQCVIFIEMKKLKSSEKNIITQLQGSLCAFKYCQIIAKEFFDNVSFLTNYRLRFISVNHTGMRTRRTSISKKCGVHDSPERLMKVSWAKTIEFNKLAA